MRKWSAIALLALAIPTALASGIGSASSQPERPAAQDNVKGFDFQVRKIKGKTRERMVGSSWRQGCPVDIDKLRLIRATHWNFQFERTQGSIVVHSDQANKIVRVLRSLYRQRFPIRKMQLIDRYDADDHKSMNADNTSGFNCRYVNGTQRWSEHAYGRAIDINPIENPYVTSSGYVSPPAGQPYANRSRDAKGMVHRGDEAFRAFAQEGWKWGGNWSGTKDYQHFSPSGR